MSYLRNNSPHEAHIPPTQNRSQNKTLDFLLVLSFITLLYFSHSSGIVDIAYTIGYVSLTVWLRFFKLQRQLSTNLFVIHLAITFSLIANFDKITGYPDDTHLLLAILMTLSAFFIFVLSITKAIVSKTLIPLVALILLVSPFVVLPLEISRNVIARLIYKNIPGIYVTKIDYPHIYGISLKDNWQVTRFSLIDGEYTQNFQTNIKGLGGGPTDAQSANISLYSLQIIKLLYTRDRISENIVPTQK